MAWVACLRGWRACIGSVLAWVASVASGRNLGLLVSAGGLEGSLAQRK